MPNSVENVYSAALMELFEEKFGGSRESFTGSLAELAAISDVLTASPDLIRFSMVPTVARGDKIDVIKNIFGGKVSDYILNFLLVLTDKGRLGRFGGIYRDFRTKYYDKFGIAPVTVTSAFPLSDEQKEKISAKMKQITGKDVELSEKTDKDLIGGVTVDYGGTRIDGSVKFRLEALKKEIAGTII
jgi:F-type H+-transporting ATPase subunit delta